MMPLHFQFQKNLTRKLLLETPTQNDSLKKRILEFGLLNHIDNQK